MYVITLNIRVNHVPQRQVLQKINSHITCIQLTNTYVQDLPVTLKEILHMMLYKSNLKSTPNSNLFHLKFLYF